MTPTDSQAASLLREVLAECEGVGCYPCIGSHSPFEDLCGRIQLHLEDTRPREDAGVVDEVTVGYDGPCAAFGCSDADDKSMSAMVGQRVRLVREQES